MKKFYPLEAHLSIKESRRTLDYTVYILQLVRPAAEAPKTENRIKREDTKTQRKITETALV